MTEREEIVAWLRAGDTWKDIVNLTWSTTNSDVYNACHMIAELVENGVHKPKPLVVCHEDEGDTDTSLLAK